MRFLLIFTKKTTPQWSQCYYDYKTMKKIIGLCRKASSIHANIMDMTGQNSNHLIQEQSNAQGLVSAQRRKEIYQDAKQRIYLIVQKANQYFFFYHDFNKKITFLFLQLKMHELQIRNKRYQYWQKFVAKQDPVYVKLLSYCYNESKLLDLMSEMNLEAYKKITKKHKKVFHNFELQSPQNQNSWMKRTIKNIRSQSNRLRTVYASHKQLYPKQARIILGEQIEPDKLSSSLHFYMFGLTNGFSVAIIFSCLILIGIYLNTNTLFLTQFRVWKFLGYIILYLWVFGTTFYIYEEYRLNYHLIFQFENSKHQSTNILSVASFLSILFLGMFVFYIMNVAGIYTLDFSAIIVFPSVLFALLLVSLIARFTYFGSGTTGFFLKTVVSIFGSFLPFVPVTFGMIWATQQLLSLTQIFADFSYSICYYSRMDGVPKTCSDTFITAQIYAICIFTIRAIQCIRVIYRVWPNRIPETYILIKCVANLSLCALSLSFAHRPGVIIWVWAVLAAFVIIYAIWIDLTIEWTLVIFSEVEEDDDVNCFWKFIGYKPVLRQKKTFSKYIYRFAICINIFLRVAWLFTINQSIIYSEIRVSDILITVSGALQLIRRGLWNVMRVDMEHINNCEKFRVKMDYDEKQDKIREQIRPMLEDNNPVVPSSASKVKKREQYLNQQRTADQISNLKEKLQEKYHNSDQIMDWINQQQKVLQALETNASKSIASRD